MLPHKDFSKKIDESYYVLTGKRTPQLVIYYYLCKRIQGILVGGFTQFNKSV